MPTCTDTRSNVPLVTPNIALRTYMTRHMGSINEGSSEGERIPRCLDSGQPVSRLGMSQSGPFRVPIHDEHRATGSESSGKRRRFFATSPPTILCDIRRNSSMATCQRVRLRRERREFPPTGFHIPTLPVDFHGG